MGNTRSALPASKWTKESLCMPRAVFGVSLLQESCLKALFSATEVRTTSDCPDDPDDPDNLLQDNLKGTWDLPLGRLGKEGPRLQWQFPST